MPEETEPPIREFADRGILWLLEAPRNLASLVELIAADIAGRLDFDRAERINRSFIPESLHKQEADLLYRVPFRHEKGDVWIYVLVENQSRPDRTMGLRILSYMVQLWELQRRGFEDSKLPISKWKLSPILPIVFYSGKRAWRSPISVSALMEVPTLLARFVPEFQTLLLPLQEMPPEQLTKTALASALRALQAADEPTEALKRALREAVVSLEGLPEEVNPEWRRALRFIYLLILHKRPAEERDDLVEAIEEAVGARHQAEAEEVLMTGAQELIARGRREGKREGRIAGAQTMLLRSGSKRFGPPDETITAELTSITSMERLEELIERIHDVENWNELLKIE